MSFAKIQLSPQSLPKSEAAVLGFFHDEPAETKKTPGSKWQAPRFLGKRSKSLEALFGELRNSQHFVGRKGEVSLLRYYAWESCPSTLLLGLGKEAKWSAEMARQAGASVFLTLRKEKLAKASVSGESVFGTVAEADLPYYLQAFCEGFWMASYEYSEMKKPAKEAFEVASLEISGLRGTKLGAAVQRAQILAKAVALARSLGDKPGNVLTPTEFAKTAERLAKERKIKCTVLGRAALEKEKMGLFVGVAKGSTEEPKLVVLEYNGGKKGEAPVAIVGKGITFDSGGISIKPASGMEDMKYDMMGAGAVAGICQAVVDLKLPINLLAVIATCENMPGGKAQKPGDVMRSFSGKTVEIVNTDAEGRLILADALEYVQAHYRPQAILDFATLTGAVVVALGSVSTGIMGTHPELLNRVKKSGEVTAEKVWELPLYEEYEEDLKSHYADIKNSGTREAGSSKGGIFLKYFVDSKMPWVHCDIAGAAYHRKDVNYHPSKFAAGVMVRLMAHLLEHWTPLK